MVGRRPHRLGGQIQAEISEIIQRRLKDPRLGFVTVTRVRLTADLRIATVYVSVMGEPEEIEKNVLCLQGASNYIRSLLGERLRVKHLPELRFRYDDSGVKGARIEELLKDLREEHGTEGEQAPEGQNGAKA